MKPQLKISVIILLLLSTINTFSQNSWKIHLGTSIPISDFHWYYIDGPDIPNENWDAGSSAVTGINLGVQYSYSIRNGKFGIFGSFDFIYSNIDKEFKRIADYLSGEFGYEIHQYPVYFNFPITGGINYAFVKKDNISLLINAGPTFNCLKIADYQRDFATDEIDWSCSIGGRIGLGIILTQRISIDFNYLGLGNHKVTARFMHDDYVSEDYTKELNIHYLTITAGLFF